MATKQLTNPAAFFADLKADLMGPTLSPTEVSATNAIIKAVGDAGWPLSWAAYALGTAFHETAHTMLPVTEANWLSPQAAARYFFRMYDKDGQRPKKAKELGNTQPGDGARYCGRGYVQLTGRTNYRNAGQKLGVDLEGQPELTLQPGIAAQVMVLGMGGGWFTGKSCKSYLPSTDAACDSSGFRRARYIINGQDKAVDIAAYALKFQKSLQAGGWA